MHINPTIFRAYDIRGIAEKELTKEVMLQIGKAIGSFAQEKEEHTLACARDARLSSPALFAALQEGILSTGCDVIDLGILPSPALYFAAHALTQSGVMVTGSHNPADYNGVKMIIAGRALLSEDIQALYFRILQQQYKQGHGKRATGDIKSDYIRAITKQIQLQRPLKVVVDSGSGVASVIAPALYRQLGCEVIELYSALDGHFPHHHPDPSVLENLSDLITAVKALKADIGLAFDGDADRLGVITNMGENIWPDRQLILYALDILSRHPGATIIYDVKCTSHLKNMIEKQGGNPIMWKTGHSLIKTKLKETGALLAGEMSGHTFFNDNWYGFDDAIYTGARLLAILAKDSRTSHDIFAEIPNSHNTPELKLAIQDDVKFDFMKKILAAADFPDGEINTIDGLRVDFKEGWGLIRASNTTPHLILRFEAMSESMLQQIQKRFADFLLALKSDLTLPFDISK